MLVKLSVRNLAVVEAADVTLGAGFNVITGETGAGKSVLMGALQLLLGERADRSLIRTGAEEASVSAYYELADATAIDATLADVDLPPCEGGVLILRRSVQANGNGRIRVNDQPATAGLLRRLAPHLTVIHGPNENRTLLDADFQLRLVTAYAGADDALAAYRARWQALQALRGELLTLAGDPAERAEEAERLSFELQEIQSVDPTEADGEALVERHAEAANAEAILSLGNALTDQLTDGERPITEQLMAAHRALRDLAKLLPEASDWGNELEGIQVQVQELARTLAERLSQVEADPDALERLENRLAQIQRLRRRYGPSLEEVFQHRAAAQARLEALNAAGDDIRRLEGAIAEAETKLLEAGEALRAKRAAALPKLSAAITAELRALGFLQASFPIQLTPCAATANGLDLVTFYFEPNPGEAARPLADIASSGEIARVMLAVKAILARHDAIPTLVFDEIDANIGGETSRCVGERLRRLAAQSQVLCITHQPQVAAFAQSHFRVHKAVTAEGRTLTQISPLAEAERRLEVARMLGGGEAALRHATTLLADLPLDSSAR